MKKLKNSIAIMLSCAIAAFLLSGCGSQGENGSAEEPGLSAKPIVAVTVVPEQTFVQKVCGDLVETIVLVPPGYSPETYEPSPQAMAKFYDSSIYFTIGLPTEETNILPTVPENIKLVSLADACKNEYEDLTIDGGRDPHIWLSPKRAVVMVQTIADEMSAIDPENAETYAANAAAYIHEIELSSQEITDMLLGLTNRSFIVFHPAFGYFADEYDLTMYSLEKDGKEATVAQLSEMIDFAKENGIKAIFYQAEIDSSQSQAFADEIGGVTIQLDPLSADYIDNLKLMAQTIAKGIS